MKRFFLLLCALLLSFACLAQKTVYNKYAMELNSKVDSLTGNTRYSVRPIFIPLLNGDKPKGLASPYKAISPITPAEIEGVEGISVVYKRYPDHELHLEIYSPKTSKRTPVVFFCHGGGWYGGKPSSMASFAKAMCRFDDITTVNVQYSLSVQDGITAEDAISDFMDAIEYVRSHADELNIDPDRLGFIGHSAGGHLAAVVAMKCPQAKVMVGWAGVYNFNTHSSLDEFRDPENQYYGPSQRYFHKFAPKALAKVSPVNMIPKDHKTAVQLFYGTCDRHVATNQAEEFGQKLMDAGFEVDMQRYQYYSHYLHFRTDKSREVWEKTRKFVRDNL